MRIEDERIIAEAPLVVRRRIKWGDIDFARVAYTARFLDYALEAAEVWFKELTGEHWSHYGVNRGIIVPVVGCSLDFHTALRPDDALDVTVLVDRVGRSSHTLSIRGHNQNGVHCFDGILTFATTDTEGRESVPMPEDLAIVLKAYKRACENGRGSRSK